MTIKTEINNTSLIVYDNDRQHIIGGLQLVGSTCYNKFFTTNTMSEAESKIPCADIDGRKTVIILKGVYFKTEAHTILQRQTFSSQYFKGEISIYGALILSGIFAINKYSINHDLGDITYFSIDITHEGGAV